MGATRILRHTFAEGSARRQFPARTLDAIQHAVADGEKRHSGQVMFAVAFRVTGQPADAEEVVMEAFTQAWREAPRFDPGRGSVAAWLTMMTRSRALDLVRAQARRERPEGRVRAGRRHLGVGRARHSGEHPDDQLPGAGRRVRDVLDPEVPRPVEHHGAHGG